MEPRSTTRSSIPRQAVSLYLLRRYGPASVGSLWSRIKRKLDRINGMLDEPYESIADLIDDLELMVVYSLASRKVVDATGVYRLTEKGEAIAERVEAKLPHALRVNL